MMQNEPLWSPSQLAAHRIAKRRSTYYSSLNLWPFVGVMVALLFLFMPWTVTHPRHVVDRPRVFHPSAEPIALREDSPHVEAVVGKIGLTGITQICFLVERGEPGKFRR